LRRTPGAAERKSDPTSTRAASMLVKQRNLRRRTGAKPARRRGGRFAAALSFLDGSVCNRRLAFRGENIVKQGPRPVCRRASGATKASLSRVWTASSVISDQRPCRRTPHGPRHRWSGGQNLATDRPPQGNPAHDDLAHVARHRADNPFGIGPDPQRALDRGLLRPWQVFSRGGEGAGRGAATSASPKSLF